MREFKLFCTDDLIKSIVELLIRKYKLKNSNIVLKKENLLGVWRDLACISFLVHLVL